MFSPRELATILAALKHWQTTVLASGADIRSGFSEFSDVVPLSGAEVTALCEQLTAKFGDPAEPCDCQCPGEFCSGVPGILARVENCRLVPGATVERCDACERYPSDEAARQKLVELGMA